MSQSTKRKHVAKEVLDEFVLPHEKQTIVKLVGGKGNNLHQVEEADGTSYLVSMPTKFRKSVWIKRGDFCIVEPIEEGDKVKAEIVHILYKEQIRYIKSENLWPFKQEQPEEKGEEEENDSEESDSDLFQNTNRVQVEYSETESSESETESEKK